MIRLTLLLVAGLGAALLIGGREIPAAQMASNTPKAGNLLAQPASADDADASATVMAGTDAAVTRNSGSPAAEKVDGAAVKAAVAQALAVPQPANAPAAEADGAASASVSVADSADVATDGAATRTAAIDVQYVNATNVNVRSGPSSNYGVVGQVTLGDSAEVVSDAGGNWVHIRVEGDGVDGYIFHKFIQSSEPAG